MLLQYQWEGTGLLILLPISHVILGNNVLGKYKLFFIFLVSILCNIQLYSSCGGDARQQKKVLENSEIRKKQE